MRIVFAEDEPKPRQAFSEAVDAIKGLTAKAVKPVVCKNRREIMNYLNAVIDGTETVPNVIFLDLQLPNVDDGFDVLKFIKLRKVLGRIPVVMISKGLDNEEVCRSYTEGASCYVWKPANMKDMRAVYERTVRFWTSDARHCRTA